MTSDSQTFGTTWILKTMKPVKISQILLQDVKSVSKTGMIHLTILNPEGMHIFEETDAWVEEILCSTGRYVPELRGIFSVFDTRVTFPARINIRKDKYVRKNNVRMLAQPTDMKENLSQYKQEQMRYVLSECQIR